MKNLSVLLLLLWLVPNLKAQMTATEIDQIVEKAMTEFTMAGCAVAVVHKGKIIFEKGYGIQSIVTKEKVNEHTNFAIASNTKAFTTAALAILVDEGKLNWTDKVKKHIPAFTMYDDYVAENFTIEDLLTHRSGLGLGAGDLMLFPDGTDFSMKDILNNFQYLKPTSAFRTKFDYDNLLYLVAGEVIARVSGMPWEDFVQTKILNPIGMNNSYADISLMTNKKNLATPHLNNNGKLITAESEKFDPKKLNGAAGSIYANVHDLSTWMLLQLNEGRYGKNLEHQLFSENNHQKMWQVHTVLNTKSRPHYTSHFAGYGLGWFLKDINGNLTVSHTGGLSGMLSKTMLVPDKDLGIVVLTNTSSDGAGVFSAVTKSIVDRYLGLEEVDWVSFFAERFKNNKNEANEVVDKIWATVKKADASNLILNDFIGTYQDKWLGQVTISKKENQLWFQAARSPKLSGPMAFYKANSFAIKWAYPNLEADAFVLFCLDEEGKAISFKMKGISPDIDFSYDFQDLDFLRVE